MTGKPFDSGGAVTLAIADPAVPGATLRLAGWRGERPGALGYVFLHAVGLSHHFWLPAARQVAERQPVLALTLAGFGESDLAPENDYSLAAQAARVAAAARAAGFERWVLVGNSLGGAVSLAAALAEPERAAGLVLVNPAAYRRGLPWVGRLGCVWGSHLALQVAPAWSHRVGLIVGGGSPGWTSALHGRHCRTGMQRPGGSDAFLRSLRALYGPELDALAPRYPTLSCPTLVLHGERDPLIPPWVSRRLAGAIPTAHLATLPRLGHFAQEEDPALVAGHCLRLARRIEG